MTEEAKQEVKNKKSEYRKSLAERGIIQFNITDSKMLYACYMPFVKGCGIFYPELSGQTLGDEVFLLLRLPETEERFATAAKVVWQNSPQKLGRRIPGLGLQIMGRDADTIRERIKELLGKQAESPMPTATM